MTPDEQGRVMAALEKLSAEATTRDRKTFTEGAFFGFCIGWMTLAIINAIVWVLS